MSEQTLSKWNDAPAWARWLAQDYNGRWYFFSDKPVMGVNEWMSLPGSMAREAGNGHINPNWRYMLEEKPK